MLSFIMFSSLCLEKLSQDEGGYGGEGHSPACATVVQGVGTEGSLAPAGPLEHGFTVRMSVATLHLVVARFAAIAIKFHLPLAVITLICLVQAVVGVWERRVEIHLSSN